MLRGDLEEAKAYLERAVALAHENGNKWYAAQALRTLGRCYLAIDDPAKALPKGEEALSLAETIGDRQAICESRLLVCRSAFAHRGMCRSVPRSCKKFLLKTTDSATDLGFTGEAQRLLGALDDGAIQTPLRLRNILAAAFRFSTCSAIVIAPRALTMNLVVRIRSSQPNRAAEQLSRAINTFRELGARIDLAKAEEALDHLDRSTPEPSLEHSALTQLLTLRLAEAVASRELLLARTRRDHAPGNNGTKSCDY